MSNFGHILYFISSSKWEDVILVFISQCFPSFHSSHCLPPFSWYVGTMCECCQSKPVRCIIVGCWQQQDGITCDSGASAGAATICHSSTHPHTRRLSLLFLPHGICWLLLWCESSIFLHCALFLAAIICKSVLLFIPEHEKSPDWEANSVALWYRPFSPHTGTFNWPGSVVKAFHSVLH